MIPNEFYQFMEAHWLAVLTASLICGYGSLVCAGAVWFRRRGR
jgi:hypothetical protein